LFGTFPDEYLFSTWPDLTDYVRGVDSGKIVDNNNRWLFFNWTGDKPEKAGLNET
jgi:hypothetical protein